MFNKKNNKILIAFLTCCLILFGFATPLFAQSTIYSDVKQSDWYYPYVKQMTEDGLILGYGNGKFGPNDYLTAAQMITILERAYGNKENIPDPSDWKTYPWHTLDWVDGSYFFGEYNMNITRNTAAYLLFSASKLPVLKPENYGYTEKITDYLFSANQYGYIIGFQDGKLHGEQLLTRAQACAILYRAIYENPNPEIPEIINPTKLNYQLLGYNNEDAIIQILEKEIRTVPTNIIDSFNKKGYKFIAACGDEYENCFKRYCGTYQTSLGFFYEPSKVIVVNEISANTINHEFGHYVQAVYGNNVKINELFKTESIGVVATAGRSYASSNMQEFFADAFMCYQLKPNTLAKNAPNTYNYIKDLLSKI